ncbi:hypothetical protein [Actinomadura madurae]|uniref:hypothetical protein n=1 Tax=Actinomadura madurae TaxID=1993 RepID=UPI0020D215D8|nr:hypothetical protein [Actinomadura madurae]MCP9955688.1 hypothetical protein [Actinomadura madurae]MCP9984933.1 hypothetical protein [Actinomadura madurae]MCQ0021128.1 hypothetical protein [Actinomadura madurae]
MSAAGVVPVKWRNSRMRWAWSALEIDANYLATEHDRTGTVDVFRAIRRLFATGPLASRIERETVPGRRPGRRRDHRRRAGAGHLRLPRHRDLRDGPGRR